MPMRKIRIAALALAWLLIATLGAVAVPSMAAVSPLPTPTFSPVNPIKGETVSFAGTVGAPVVRTVKLQYRSGSRWRTLVTGRSIADGTYELSWVALRSRTLRIKAPETKIAGVRYRTRYSARFVIKLASTGLTLTGPTERLRGESSQLKATAVPARANQLVSFEMLDQGTWVQKGTATQNEAGQATFSVPALTVGTHTWRASTQPSEGVLGLQSESLDLRTHAAPSAVVRINSPQALSQVSGSVEVQIKAPNDAGEVRLFVDGTRHSNAVRTGDGLWSATWDAGSHADGLARLNAWCQCSPLRGLSSAVTVQVHNPIADSSSTLPEGFRVTTMTTGLNLPTSFITLDQHRVLVTEKDGLVRLVVDGQLISTPVLDVSASVANYWDQGLIGITKDPDFEHNGWFYLAYSLKLTDEEAALSQFGETAQQVARFTLDGQVADPASKHVVVGSVRGPQCWDHIETADCMPLLGGSHTIDDLMFDPTGALLISVGDGVMGDFGIDMTQGVRAQNPKVLAGKILRVDPATGRGLPDNPMFEADHPESNQSRVLAMGLRNPFRMTLHGEDLYVGDVGFMDTEEINKVVPGGNYGWPCIEGTANRGDAAGPVCAGLQDGSVTTQAPWFSYPHGMTASVTAGAFLDSPGFPDEFESTYLFGDFARSQIFTLSQGQQKVFAYGDVAGMPVKFGAGPDNWLWYVSVATGDLRRISYDPTSSSCPARAFAGRHFDSALPDALLNPPVVTTCADSAPSGVGYTPPAGAAGWFGFTSQWSGKPRLAPGRYTLSAHSSGTLRVEVDGAVVTDSFVVPAHSDSTSIKVTLGVFGASDPDFELSWTRQAGPSVSITGVTDGQRVDGGETIGWNVTAVGPDGQALPASSVTSRISLLHYSPDEYVAAHAHPSGTFTGLDGTFAPDDDHAPGYSVFRIDAWTTGEQIGVAEPVFICTLGSAVGPCR